MTKKIKKKIVRIAIGAVLMVLGIIVSKLINEWVGLGVFIAAYVVIAYDVLRMHL